MSAAGVRLHPIVGRTVRWGVFVGRRLLSALLALLGIVLLVFIVTHMLGDPVYLLIGQRATPEQLEALRHQFGYDRPIWQQLLSYLAALPRGDLGVSRYTFQPVSTEIAQRFPTTIELSAAAMVLGLAWTIPLGVLAARRPGGAVDRIGRALVEFGVAMPSFWLGLLLVFVFFYLLQVAPTPIGQLDVGILPPPKVTGLVVVDSLLAGDLVALRSALAHLALPAITLAVTACPPILQLTRNVMVGVLDSDYVRGARRHGLKPSTVYWRLGLKNALLPVVTMTAMTFGYLLGGTVLVETVFAWPGLGLYAVQSMQRFDYEPVLGVVLLASTVYVLVYLLADLAALAIDPRTRDAD
jgi:ABC-type dipeptide/oligopeptide/nickel transport system permease component